MAPCRGRTSAGDSADVYREGSSTPSAGARAVEPSWFSFTYDTVALAVALMAPAIVDPGKVVALSLPQAEIDHQTRVSGRGAWVQIGAEVWWSNCSGEA